MISFPYFNKAAAITIRCTSEVPSYISVIFASRIIRSDIPARVLQQIQHGGAGRLQAQIVAVGGAVEGVGSMAEMMATANAKSIEEIKSFLSRQKEVYKIPLSLIHIYPG